jgi:hypothetical protein
MQWGMEKDDSEPRFIISVVDPCNVWGLISDVSALFDHIMRHYHVIGAKCVTIAAFCFTSPVGFVDVALQSLCY